MKADILFVSLWTLAGAHTSSRHRAQLHSSGHRSLEAETPIAFSRRSLTFRPQSKVLSKLSSVTALPRGGSYNNQYYDDEDRYGEGSYDYRGDKGGYYDDNRGRDYYDDRGDYYDDRGAPEREGRGNPLSNMELPSVVKNGNRKIGVPLLGVGAALTVLGISLFFNKTLMRLGNLFFVAGVPLTIGPGRTAGYFFQPTKARATACLTFGIFLVFVGWPVFGILLEVFGLLNLFGNMFPVAMAVLKTMPVIGPILRGQGGNDNSRRKPRNNDRYQDDDRYYDDRNYYNDGGDQDDYNQQYY